MVLNFLEITDHLCYLAVSGIQQSFKLSTVNRKHSWCILNSLNKQKKRKEIGYLLKYQEIGRNNISCSFNSKIDSSKKIVSIE